MSLNGKVAVVTGATRGIGQAIALALGNMEATVIGTATTEEGAHKISAFFAEKGMTGKGLVLDVSQPSSICEVMSFIETTYGTPEVLVNNAAITRDNLMLRMKDDDWDQVIEVNLNSAYRTSKALLKGMMKARWGRIINITSIVGVIGNAGQVNYAAAKAGLIGFTKSLAREIASRNITVNCVAPGFIDTDMTRVLSDKQKEMLNTEIPMGRIGQAEEVAAAVAFLASLDASYITGQTLHVNGGMYMA